MAAELVQIELSPDGTRAAVQLLLRVVQLNASQLREVADRLNDFADWIDPPQSSPLHLPVITVYPVPLAFPFA